MDDRAIARALDLAHVLDTDLALRDGGVMRPLVAWARKLAIDAMRDLMALNTADPLALEHAQNAVWRAQALVKFPREAFADAEEHWETLSDDERAEISTFFHPDQDEELNDA